TIRSMNGNASRRRIILTGLTSFPSFKLRISKDGFMPERIVVKAVVRQRHHVFVIAKTTITPMF
ncbi:hypothetical protein, partial [Klebsiella pneumoniae]|uniref:hypothetical protein n=1 Tax=Klebsiella pneumoniae TaxID=573 RepID=UPI001C6FD71F